MNPLPESLITPAAPPPAARGLRPMLLPAEPRWLGATCVLMAVLITAAYVYATACYWVPVHPGVDQNGYLVGARQLAATGTMKLRPTLPGTDTFDPHQFVGRMWVGADLLSDAERYYPKYPIGLPLLYAAALWIGGPKLGPSLVYSINPAAMTVAVWMTFWLARRLAGSIAGVLAMLLFATSPVTVSLTTNPNSHATAVCCVVSGMFFLLQWWRKGTGWRAFAAGLLLGYAVTIRYSEGSLLLPMALVALFTLRWRDRRSWAQVGLLALGWLIPVGGLVAYNLAAMGTITGYDPTNESLGFSLEYAADNWETTLRQLSTTGLFFAMPLAAAGLAGMYWRNWRTALVLSAWVLPCLAIYTFYYWAPDTSHVGYLRFYLTILPALAAAAAWAGRAMVDVAAQSSRTAAGAVLAGFALVMLIAATAQLRQATELIENDQSGRLALAVSVEQIGRAIPEGSAVVCGDSNLLHHLQFVRNDLLYLGDTFNRGSLNSLTAGFDPNEPQGLDPQRRAALAERFAGYDQKRLDDEQSRVIEAALASGRRMFYVLPLREGIGLPGLRLVEDKDREPFRRSWPELLRRMVRGTAYDATIVSSWNVPPVRAAAERAAPRARRPELRRDRRAGYWHIVEVTRRPPATTRPAAVAADVRAGGSTSRRPPPATRASAPATRPATRPTTAPGR